MKRNTLFTIALIATLSVIGCKNKKDDSSSFSEVSSTSIGESSSESTFDESNESLNSESSLSIEESLSDSESIDSSSLDEENTYDTSIYGDYYDDVLVWQDGRDLKNKLYEILHNGYNPLPYGNYYEMNITADKSENDFEYLDVMYSEESVYKDLTNTGWQREHAFVAKRMGYANTGEATANPGMGTDYHNLFASSQAGNSSRSAKEYGVANVEDAHYSDAHSYNNGEDGYSYDEFIFEPGNKDKGRCSRAIFYMATMYKDDLTIEEESSTVTQGNLPILLEWNNFDVDRLEMQHNLTVYTHEISWSKKVDGVTENYTKAQGNRNPYVDYPELVDYVFGDKQDDPGELKYLKPSILDLGYEQDTYCYAIESAKRNYTVGETLTSNDYKVVKMHGDFTYENVESSSLLDGHVFASSDEKILINEITVDEQKLEYVIKLSGMEACSYYSGELKKESIDLTKPNQDQTVTWNNEKFTLNVNCKDTSGKISSQNKSTGGFKLGSGTYPIYSITLTSENEFSIDTAYIKAVSDTKGYSYHLEVKVGDEIVLKTDVDDNNGTKSLAIFGGEVLTPNEGQVSYILTPNDSDESVNPEAVSLILHSIAFNEVID